MMRGIRVGESNVELMADLLRSESDRPPERFSNGVCMLTINLHADSHSAFGNFPEERPIIFDDVALFD